MSRKSFEEKLRKIDALRDLEDPAAAEAGLKKVLKDRSNFAVKKGANIVRERGLTDLLPDLLAAYDRFFDDPEKTDPQCWAKTALATALKDLGHDDPEPFYRGLAHVQWEPTWGGKEDSAGSLRATCVVALPGCRADTFELLLKLTDALADSDKGVRAEAALTIGHLGHEAGAAPLRLKAKLGDAEPEVLGACLSALLTLDAFEPVPFVRGFLESLDEDTSAEAAGALAAANQPEAFAAIRAHWERRPEARRAIASALAASPREGALELWREAIEREPLQVAEAALDAFIASRFRDKLSSEIEVSINRRDSASLSRTWKQLTAPASDP